jgi:hypothetical protein
MSLWFFDEFVKFKLNWTNGQKTLWKGGTKWSGVPGWKRRMRK